MRDEKENERVQTRPGKIKEKNFKKKKKSRDSNSRNGGRTFRTHFLSLGTPLVGSFGLVSSSA